MDQSRICDLVPPESEHRWKHGERPADGWKLLDKALLSMRRGERCSIQCTDERLREGATVAVPEGQDSWLLNVELHDFIETSDVSFEKDGSVVKRSVHGRDVYAKCQALGTCQLHLDGVHDGREAVTAVTAVTATLGCGELCDALEAVVLQMREHEVAEVTADAELCDWTTGTTGQSSNFKLEVQKYEPGDWERAASDDDKLQVLMRRKDEAVKLLKMGRWRLAAYHFHDVHQLLGYIDDFRGLSSGQERARRVQELKEACLLNRALCLIKVQRFGSALRCCDALLGDALLTSLSRKAKARLRRAQANLGLDDCAEALRDCHRLGDTEVAVEAKRLENEVRRRQKVLDKEAKNLYDKTEEHELVAARESDNRRNVTESTDDKMDAIRAFPSMVTAERAIGTELPRGPEVALKRKLSVSRASSPVIKDASLAMAISGGFSGCVAKTCVAPLSRTVIQMQLHSLHQDTGNMFTTMRGIWREGGLPAFWRGNMATLWHRAVVNCVNFPINELCKSHVHGCSDNVRSMISAFGGSFAGVCVGHPIDVVKTRLSAAKRFGYSGILKTVSKIHMEEGLGAFFAGFRITVVTVVPNVACCFYLRDLFKQSPIPSVVSSRLGGWVNDGAVAGGAAGGVAAALFYPVDALKRQQQMGLAVSFLSNNGALSVPLLRSWQGLLLCYRGLLPELIKAGAYQQAWQKLKPDQAPPDGRILPLTYRVQPLPAGTNKEILLAWASTYDWNIKPLRPVGAKQWLICSDSPPPPLLMFNSQPLLAQQVINKPPALSSAIAAGPRPRAPIKQDKSNSQAAIFKSGDPHLDPWSQKPVTPATVSTAPPGQTTSKMSA
ncbi:unnamed protein product [Cladocopium goreaui]|uniref:Uncharacterized protein n=1 Tax=Cladocopium goreaui TaxID=2562237 RepID=A0A9P1FYH5_9DINO|nr:unnamed protein product [Cladocopium goreaui]